jgi:hypothetical protein
MEMYWAGASSAAIDRELDMPLSAMYVWVHDFGSLGVQAKLKFRFNEKPIHFGR